VAEEVTLKIGKSWEDRALTGPDTARFSCIGKVTEERRFGDNQHRGVTP